MSFIRIGARLSSATLAIGTICLVVIGGDSPDQGTYQSANTSAGTANPSGIQSPRETVRQFLQHVRRGEPQDAFAATTRGAANSWSADFEKLQDFDCIRPLHQLGTYEHAMVTSNLFHGRGRPEVLYAVLVNSEGQWRLSRSGCVKPDEALWMMKGYLANPAVQFDVLPEEVLGAWRAMCDSTIILSADGTGTELRVGPGGPTPGMQPEPFEWQVRGNKLERRFADRQETLEMTWIDDDSINFRETGESGWGYWHRR